jgi:S1-C subfamily serine protease
VWEAATGKEIATLEGWVVSATFSPDGQRIVTASGRWAHIWPVLPKLQDLVDNAKARLARCLTEEERKAFFLSDEAPDWCYEMSKWPYKPRRWGVSYATPTDKQSVRLGLHGAEGLIVTHVAPGLPGEAAGFEDGDFIMRIGVEPVHTVDHADALLAIVPAGRPVPVTIRRGAEVKVLTIAPRF